MVNKHLAAQKQKVTNMVYTPCSPSDAPFSYQVSSQANRHQRRALRDSRKTPGMVPSQRQTSFPPHLFNPRAVAAQLAVSRPSWPCSTLAMRPLKKPHSPALEQQKQQLEPWRSRTISCAASFASRPTPG